MLLTAPIVPSDTPGFWPILAIAGTAALGSGSVLVLAAKIDALHERHERACRSTKDAEWERDGLWDRYSQMLPPLPAVPFSRAYGLPADFEFR
jgi:hypothetical protein